jgi:two-component system sensor histidine kinase KdpD
VTRFDRQRLQSPQSPVRALAIGAGMSALASTPAIATDVLSTATAALVHVVAVVAAARLGGFVAGASASLLSFLALNYFFTPPLRPFNVDKAEDLVALVVFVVVAILVGALVSTAIANRARSEKREQQARLLNEVANRLLAGESAAAVLQDFAQAAVRILGVVGCVISSEATRTPVVAGRTEASRPARKRSVEMMAAGRQIGEITVYLDDRSSLNAHEEEVLRGLGGQLALALQGLQMAERARVAQLQAETGQFRAALFSSVTDDLRAPLASITASVTSLLQGGRGVSDKSFEKPLETIRDEAQRLDRLVGNLLDLSRLRAGGLAPKKVRASLDEVIEGAMSRLHETMGDREVQLTIRQEPLEIEVDVVQLDQLLTNVLENAAKFSPPGSVVTISATSGPDRVRVSVTDQGPGIPKSDRRRVFEPFVRGEATGAGAGLGLSIAQAIAVAHGGRMWVADSPTGGASVVFELPVTDRAGPGGGDGERQGIRRG